MNKISGLLFFLLLFSSELIAKEIELTAYFADDGQLSFNLVNKSKNNIIIYPTHYDAFHIVVKLVKQNGESIEPDLWRIKDDWSDKIVLNSGHSHKFTKNLKDNYSSIDNILTKNCVFIFWAAIIKYGESKEHKEVFSGSIDINKALCFVDGRVLADEF
ncbi:MAG: hypothetical protein OEY19_11455 [Gammaproteobacteria bacterium]|nr:hypothetical protein [Gammaproteobacteria bacterium]